MLHYPEVGEVAWSTGLVVSIGSTGAAPVMFTAAGRPAGPAARPGSNGTMSPRWSSAVRDRQRRSLYARPVIVCVQHCTAGARAHRQAGRAMTLRRRCPQVPAICQQPSLTSPQPAPRRFIANCVLGSTDTRQRVDACCGASGRLVNGMQGVRGSNPLSSTQVSGPLGRRPLANRPPRAASRQQSALEGRSSVRHGGPAGQHRWRRRPVDPGRAGGPVRDLAAPPGTEGHGPGPTADGWDAPIGMAPGGSCGAVAPTTISKYAVSRLPAAGVRRQPCRSRQSSRPSA